MARKRLSISLVSVCISAIALLAPAALANEAKTMESSTTKNCDMTYSLKGWSAVYKTAKGEGTITCDNGQTANVVIKVHGGGATFGKTEIYNGKAEISGVHSIDQIFG